MLRKDKEEVEAIKHAKALEAEKAMYSVGPPLCRCAPGHPHTALSCLWANAALSPWRPPGPSLPATEEGVQGEAAEGTADQPAQVRGSEPSSGVIPHGSLLFVSCNILQWFNLF